MGSKNGGLDSVVRAVFALVRALVCVNLFVSPHRVVVARAVAALVTAVRLVSWKMGVKVCFKY